MPGNKIARQRTPVATAGRFRRRRRFRSSVVGGAVQLRREMWRGSGWQITKWPTFLLIGALAGLLYVMVTFDNFYVYRADIRGTSLLSADEIYQAAGIEGYNVFWLDEQTLATRILRQLPYVIGVDAQLQLPNQVHLVITERRPRIAWETNQGQAWVDEQGVALPPLPTAPARPLLRLVDLQQATIVPQPAGQPPVIGPGGLPVVHMQTEVVQALLTLATLLPGTQTFYFDAQNGLNLRTADGASVIFGTKGDLNRKVAVLQAIQAEWKKMGRTPAQIDLRVAERPYVR
ncbi:MAG: FtsQ-type POTRA domain-containing protein [Anaerolineae bacterium]|uniref:cell division protein FtsQ/DivIB n=1 Tax=Candidatus Amarolinea dominans TaxID=3140696 RepID=UPI001D6B4D29|nr:FtsQ-type POTRA domain-containing protein [Anaerolineae bacterium]MBK7199916.1 FtsQ-type POTRA domain-containing protein [Anaerolineae bacterium]